MIIDKTVKVYALAAAVGVVVLYVAYRAAKGAVLSVATNAPKIAASSADATFSNAGTMPDGLASALNVRYQDALVRDSLSGVFAFGTGPQITQAVRNRANGLRLDGSPKDTTPLTPLAGTNDPEMAKLLRQDAVLALSNTPDQTEAESQRLLMQGLPFNDSNAVTNSSAGAQNATSDVQEQSSSGTQWYALGA